MSTVRTLIESLGDFDVSLEAFDRRGDCVRQLNGAAVLEAVRAYRPRFAGGSTAGLSTGGRKLMGLLFRSEETIEFLVATFASLAQGYTVVPLYPNWDSDTQLLYLERYGVRSLAVGDGFLQRARQWEGTQIERLVPVSLQADRMPPLDEANRRRPIFAADPPPQHACAWIFTSGTSGELAKCTEITTENLDAAIENIRDLEFLRPGMTFHSPLSTSHVFAFVVTLGLLALRPRRALFSDVQYLSRLTGEKTGKVDALLLVPIVLNRMRCGFYDKLTSEIDKRTAPPELQRLARIPRSLRRYLKRFLRRAEDSLLALEEGRLRGKLALPRILMARRLFGKLIQKRLGNPDFVVVGGAKPNLSAMAFLEVLGVRCLQGWGMTETTGPLAVCDLKDRFKGAFGTCGDLFPRSRAMVEDGELIVEGPQIARGYVSPDGSLTPFDGRKRTGDSAIFDSRGRLKVLGKVGDRITTDNGLNYNPVPMEDDLKAADLILNNVLEEAVVIGDGKPRLGCVFFVREDVEVNAELESYLGKLVRGFNSARGVDEQIGPWRLSDKGLRDVGGLGPSGKLVRRRIEERFASIYGEVLV